MEELPFPPEYQQQIESWLRSVKFRRRMVGGVDEAQVWARIRELNDLYQKALAAERARYDALLAAQKKGVDSP